jgi:hypothetical protein
MRTKYNNATAVASQRASDNRRTSRFGNGWRGGLGL